MLPSSAERRVLLDSCLNAALPRTGKTGHKWSLGYSITWPASARLLSAVDQFPVVIAP